MLLQVVLYFTLFSIDPTNKNWSFSSTNTHVLFHTHFALFNTLIIEKNGDEQL